MQSLRTVFLYGGMGEECGVSLESAAHLLAHVPEDVTPIPIGITKEGEWHLCPPHELPAQKGSGSITLAHGAFLHRGEILRPDAVFPILHGSLGEDGTVAGLLETLGFPFVGCTAAAGAVGMNKAQAKSLVPSVPSLPHLLFSPAEIPYAPSEILCKIGLPAFLKPNKSGSSLGAAPVTSESDLLPALHRAAVCGEVLCEPLITAREVEVGILETDTGPLVSRPGEVLKPGKFYDYSAKYEAKTVLAVPAELPSETAATLRGFALHIFRRLGCRDLARVDFFLTEKGEIFFNEINTMPGFTADSMYPRLWEKEGYPLSDLIGHLCRRAAARRL